MEVAEGLKWIAGTIITLLSMLGSAFGVSKLLEIRANRHYALADKNSDIHESRQVRQIEFDQYAFQKFAERLEKIEAELKETHEKLSFRTEQNARLEIENRHLREVIERQEKELEGLRRRETILDRQVSLLTNLVSGFQGEIDVLKKGAK